MPKNKNLEDQIFGKLVVVEKETDPRYKKHYAAVWYCLCECGGFCRATTVQLTGGHRTHCGCMPKVARPKCDITGQQFGELTALFPSESIGGKTSWMMQCSCGKYRRIQLSLLRAGYAKSCGCKQSHRGRRTKHVYETIDQVCRI